MRTCTYQLWQKLPETDKSGWVTQPDKALFHGFFPSGSGCQGESFDIAPIALIETVAGLVLEVPTNRMQFTETPKELK